MKMNTYKVRDSIMAALATDRPEMLRFTSAELIERPFSLEESRELLRLLGDLMVDRQKRAERIRELRVYLRHFRDFASGLSSKTEELRMSITELENVDDEDRSELESGDA